MAIKQQHELAHRLNGWLMEREDEGFGFEDLLGSTALVLGYLLGSAAAGGDPADAEVIRMVLEQRFATEDAMDEEEGLEPDEEEENEGDRIEGDDEDEEGGDEYPE